MYFRLNSVKNFQYGFTYVEVLVSVTITAILVGSLMGVINTATSVNKKVNSDNDFQQQAHFAMQHMVNVTGRTRKLLLPQVDKPASNWPENIREETVPPSPPIGDSIKATAVLAVTLPEDIDLNGDGFPDADDDQDGLIDEDLPDDVSNDSTPGIYLIDDDGDGLVDEDGPYWWNDDETFTSYNEDPIDGIDNDGDNNIDEDPPADINADGCSGICGVDDNADGSVDEGNNADDDEDGQQDEDWYNLVVFYLDNGVLKERISVPWDENGQGGVTGRDYVTSDLAEDVTHFRVERIATTIGGVQLVDILLELTHSVTGEQYSLQTQVRVGGML